MNVGQDAAISGKVGCRFGLDWDVGDVDGGQNGRSLGS
jgi:hypothetical protein